MNLRRWLKAVLALCLCVSALQAVIAEAAGLNLAVRSTDASQFPKVSMTVSVVDNFDIPIDLVGQGLAKSAVSLAEDNVPVADFQIQPTFDPQQAYAIAIMVDTSSTMGDASKIAATKTALNAFVDEMGQQDSVAILSFSDQVKTLQGYTSDKSALKTAIGQLSTGGGAAMFDAIGQAAGFQAAISQKRRVLLVVTDGGDTASKQTQAAATDAARGANVPIYAIGIGPDAPHDVLDQMAGNTTGQVIYVTGAADLPAKFQDFADRLRRLWVISYTSKLTGDDHNHTLSITVNSQGQTQTGQGTFTAKSNAVAFQVSGLVDATRVTGTIPVTVTVTNGKIASAQLLVDDQQRQSVTSAPYVFQWDTTKETTGIHRVVVRVIGTDGTPTDQKYVVEAVAPTAAPASPTAVTALIATPVATPSQSNSSVLPYVIGGLIAALVVAIAAVVFVLSRRKPAIKLPSPPSVAPVKALDDRTEVMRQVIPEIEKTRASGSLTMDMAAPAPAPSKPLARVRLLQDGKEQVIDLGQPETLVGRNQANNIVLVGQTVSGFHARFVLESGEFWIEDRNSRNGLTVNGEKTTRRKLASGDQVKIGEAILTFVVDGK